MDEFDYSKINARLISSQNISIDETIILTGGLKAKSYDDLSVTFYPIWKNGPPICGNEIACRDFQGFLKDRSIEVIGIKQDTKTENGNHWRWAPAKACHNPPHNNPSYRWTFISSGLRRSIKAGTSLNFIGDKSSQIIPDVDANKLSDLAQHIAIDLHQMNQAIVMMAEHLHNDLVGNGPRCSRYEHIRHFDLSSHIHAFFQAFSAARDHYAQFVAIQIDHKTVKGEHIDSMSKLLNSVDPVHLRELKTFNTLEKNNLVILGEGRGKKHGGKCRLCYKSGTWLKGANDYRNRFTHESPYGTLPEENVLEVYQPDCDDTLFMAKAFFAQEEGDFPPNVLRTTNHLYQNICGFFLLCSEFTGYSSDPPSINLTNDM